MIVKANNLKKKMIANNLKKKIMNKTRPKLLNISKIKDMLYLKAHLQKLLITYQLSQFMMKKKKLKWKLNITKSHLSKNNLKWGGNKLNYNYWRIKKKWK